MMQATFDGCFALPVLFAFICLRSNIARIVNGFVHPDTYLFCFSLGTLLAISRYFHWNKFGAVYARVSCAAIIVGERVLLFRGMTSARTNLYNFFPMHNLDLEFIASLNSRSSHSGSILTEAQDTC